MGIRVDKMECEYCSGTAYCPTCLGSGALLDSSSQWKDCTACWSGQEGKCCYCQGKGHNEHVYEVEDESDVHFDFGNERDEDLELDK